MLCPFLPRDHIVRDIGLGCLYNHNTVWDFFVVVSEDLEWVVLAVLHASSGAGLLSPVSFCLTRVHLSRGFALADPTFLDWGESTNCIAVFKSHFNNFSTLFVLNCNKFEIHLYTCLLSTVPLRGKYRVSYTTLREDLWVLLPIIRGWCTQTVKIYCLMGTTQV